MQPVAESITGGGSSGGAASGIWLKEPLRTTPPPTHVRVRARSQVGATLPLDVEEAVPEDDVDPEAPPDDDDVTPDDDDAVSVVLPPHATATTEDVATAASSLRRSASAWFPIRK